MKTSLVAVSGFLLVGAVYACSVPNVQGESPSQGDRGADTSGGDTTSKKNATSPKTRAPSNTTTPTTTQSTAVDAGATSTPTDGGSIVTTTAGSSSSSSSSSGSSGSTSEPACRNDADPISCLDCCLASNPGAQVFEDNYGDCLGTCDVGDQNCVDLCFQEHTSECNTSADCLQNHACMAANNCLVSNLCAGQ